MKKYIFVIILLAIALAKTVNSQTNNTSISFTKIVHNFGTIKEEDGKVSVSFDFINSGKGPLIIQRVVSSCDCAAVDWTKEPLVTGASGFIRVIFNPKGRIGKFDKLITVYTNAETPSVILKINGVVIEKNKTPEDIYVRAIGDFKFDKNHASFGRMYSNEVKTDTIRFYNTSDKVAKIGCNSLLPYLTIKFIPETIKPKEKGILLITFDAKIKNDWGIVVDRFSLTQDDKEVSGSKINVSASIEENFSSLTETQRANAPIIDLPNPNYNFGNVVEGSLIEKEFVFTNKGKSDLIIRKIKSSCGCTTVEPDEKIIKPGITSRIKATVRSNGFSGRIAKSITIITNDPVNPSIIVRLVGDVNPPKK